MFYGYKVGILNLYINIFFGLDLMVFLGIYYRKYYKRVFLKNKHIFNYYF